MKLTILITIFFVAAYILGSRFSIPPASAQQSCVTQTSYPRVDGLITTPKFDNTNNKFGNPQGNCVVDANKAPMAPYKIPTYKDLESIYYDQSKATKIEIIPPSGTANQGTLTSNLNSNYDVILIKGNLTINGNISATPKPAVIFVRGNLSIERNIGFAHNNPAGGLVFIVEGDINITASSAQTVTQIDAVLISQGIICTAYDDGCPANNVTTSQLTIYGSLVSLNQTDQCPNCPIKFRRTLDPNQGDNNTNAPAEKILQQPKYLVILRDIYAETWQKWSEIQ